MGRKRDTAPASRLPWGGAGGANVAGADGAPWMLRYANARDDLGVCTGRRWSMAPGEGVYEAPS